MLGELSAWEANAEYGWRRCEAKLNSYPQFVTNIDGLDIHFIYVKSKEKNALPIIINDGWPGSIVEQLKLIDPLTNPTAHGGRAEDAFDVVIPDMPGYGFSGKPTATGWGPDHIARAWVVLMKRLGYTKFVAQGLRVFGGRRARETHWIDYSSRWLGPGRFPCPDRVAKRSSPRRDPGNRSLHFCRGT